MIHEITLSALFKLKGKSKEVLPLFPKIGINMDLNIQYRKGDNIYTFSHEGIEIAKAVHGLGKPITDLKVIKRKELIFPYISEGLAPVETLEFYPIMDALGTNFIKTPEKGFKAEKFDPSLFSGIQSLGVEVTAQAVGVFNEPNGRHSAVLMHIGSNLGALITWHVESCEMNLFLLDVSEHNPIKLAMILDVGAGGYEGLHAIAVTHRKKYFDKDHPKYLNDWE